MHTHMNIVGISILDFQQQIRQEAQYFLGFKTAMMIY